MATPSRHERPVRSLVTLGVLVVAVLAAVLAGTRWSDATLTPKLALDLEGGTQIILQPVAQDDSEVTDDTIAQAIEIIRQRVDASGVSEAEISSQGGQGGRFIVVALPGRPDEATLDLVRQSAQMLFRPVLAVTGPAPTQTPGEEGAPEDGTSVTEGDGSDDGAAEDGAGGDGAAEDAAGEDAAAGDEAAAGDAEATGDTAGEGQDTEPAPAEGLPTPEPADASDLAWLTEDVLAEYAARDCTDAANLTGGAALIGDPDAAVVACDAQGFAKYVLGPVEVEGQDIDTAVAGNRVGPTGAILNDFVVNLDFNSAGTAAFRDVTTRLVGLEAPRNQFAMVLDGLVISAPSVNSVITNGSAEISGGFTQNTASTLARQLSFGALPLTFEVQSEQQISATLGSEQLEKGLLAGAIGLALVALYSLAQYRGLGLVTIASLVVAGIAAYAAITFLSWTYGYRLSLAGVAGLIVSIGITADSFIVYFERVKDELRDGRSLRLAIAEGWTRARRTILASDAISLLAAIVLYALAVGSVRGFAFTLGLMTLIDLAVVFLFTHPVLVLLSRRRFFASGHPLSGLDPRLLQSRTRYVGRGKVALDLEGDAAAPPGTDASREPVPATAGRRTIAERRAAAASRPADVAPHDPKDA